MLAHRPPIELPRTTVAPALLEELLGEISSLASVYHKPAETFVGRGRIGADALARKAGECVTFSSPCFFIIILHPSHSIFVPFHSSNLDDTRQATQRALQTVVIGQQAENLLNFDDDDTDGAAQQQPVGIAATAALASTPAAANLLAGTSSNPLDDLVSIFGNAGISSVSSPPVNSATSGGDLFGGLAFGQTTTAAPSTPGVLQAASPPPAPAQHQQKPQAAQEDLLGLF